MKTNTKLEQEFNLTPLSLVEENNSLKVQEEPEETSIDHYKELDKIEAALPQVHGLDSSDRELDELADYAIQAHKDLLDLAMNVEQRFIGEIAGASSNMLAHAITARTNKLKKKLDMISLQIRKQVADNRAKPVDDKSSEIDDGATVMDRNELLQQLLSSKK